LRNALLHVLKLGQQAPGGPNDESGFIDFDERWVVVRFEAANPHSYGRIGGRCHGARVQNGASTATYYTNPDSA
jgi:hypothetical protein